MVPPSKTGYNAFANVLYNQGNFSAGMRYESYLNAVIGFPGRFNGSGVGYRFARYNDPERGVDVTVGNFYDQFGSGLVFRSYEERNLGIDNAMDGFRLILKPIDGVQAKFIYGKQRFDFDNGLVNGPGVVRAVDVETDLNALVEGWKEKPLKVTAAASFVSKFQAGSPFSVDSLGTGHASEHRFLVVPHQRHPQGLDRQRRIRRENQRSQRRQRLHVPQWRGLLGHPGVQPKRTGRVVHRQNGRQHELPLGPRFALV